MKQHRLMSRVGALVLGLAVAIATLSLASAQQEPPHRFYGTGATAGDMIGVVDDMGNELGSTEVAEDGSWYIDVDRDDADNVSFTLNGKSADAEVTSAGSGQSAVAVTAWLWKNQPWKTAKRATNSPTAMATSLTSTVTSQPWKTATDIWATPSTRVR